MGEDHQVTTELGNIQNKLAPISFVVGLATFNGAETGEQLAFIGDSLTEWYYNGKILGVNVSGTDDGGTKVTAQPIEVSGLDEVGVKSELEKSGFTAPEEGDSTLSSIIEDYRTRIEEAASKLAALAAEMAAIMEEYNILVPQPEEEVVTAVTSQEMAGTYSGSAALAHVEEDVEAPDSLPVTLQLNEAGTGTVNVNGYSGDAQCAGSTVTFSVAMEEDGAAIYCVFEGTVSRNGSQIVISGNMHFSMMGVTFSSYTWSAHK
ncbi:MAG: hypothetical protein EOM14_14390 [Clostridia bacterium]|nr:hypothetical protein [Clostridia bacterium]